VRGGRNAAQMLRGLARGRLLPGRLPGRVPLVLDTGVTLVVFLLCDGVSVRGGRMPLVGGGAARSAARSAARCLARNVRAGRGGEHAAPASQDDRPGETKIYQLSRHVIIT
jgi:hypothetical protein